MMSAAPVSSVNSGDERGKRSVALTDLLAAFNLDYLRDEEGVARRRHAQNVKCFLILSVPVLFAVAQSVVLLVEAGKDASSFRRDATKLETFHTHRAIVESFIQNRSSSVLNKAGDFHWSLGNLSIEVHKQSAEFLNRIERSDVNKTEYSSKAVGRLLKVLSSLLRLAEQEELQRDILNTRYKILELSLTVGRRVFSLGNEFRHTYQNPTLMNTSNTNGYHGNQGPDNDTSAVYSSVIRENYERYSNCSAQLSLNLDKLTDVASHEINAQLDVVSSAALRGLLLGAVSLFVTLIVAPLIIVGFVRWMDRDEANLGNYALRLAAMTTELDKEKKVADDLLHRLLPPAVASDLMNDQSILAESYQSVTIYFSDIVGFTSICADSSPMQVVQFLNQLYTEFDKRIDLYDVYKVETIGDAYMLVSGCPRLNGIRHAGEIGTLSLDLLNMIRGFKIAHQPERTLMLRIGVHSGPCVAAVVGDKMPRYCLFGETVNVASRMESSGQAMRIQVSEGCKNLLDRLGRYDLDERGQVEVKENEFTQTYWLTGKEGYSFDLQLDVCVFIPKKVKLDRVIVKKSDMSAAKHKIKKSSSKLVMTDASMASHGNEPTTTPKNHIAMIDITRKEIFTTRISGGVSTRADDDDVMSASRRADDERARPMKKESVISAASERSTALTESSVDTPVRVCINTGRSGIVCECQDITQSLNP